MSAMPYLSGFIDLATWSGPPVPIQSSCYHEAWYEGSDEQGRYHTIRLREPWV